MSCGFGFQAHFGPEMFEEPDDPCTDGLMEQLRKHGEGSWVKSSLDEQANKWFFWLEREFDSREFDKDEKKYVDEVNMKLNPLKSSWWD